MGITFGSSSAPSQVTVNLDSVFATSLSAYKKELIDNIGATNAFFFEMIKKQLYEPQSGSDIRIPLMYAFAPADSYDGYDELSTVPTDGITQAVFEWRQCAAPIAYSMKEVKQNKQRIVDLVTSRIKQAEMGLQEYFSNSFMYGALADGGSITSARTSTVNGSSSIDPLFKLIAYDPTASLAVGNIQQSSNTWWRNKTADSAATTYDGLLFEADHGFNSTALGTGGKPKIMLADQTTYELIVHALYQKWRQTQTDQNFPFENTMFKGAHLVMDDKVPNAYSGVVATTLYGTLVYINSDFFKMIHEEESDFAMLTDDKGKTFQKPVNGDSRVGHMAWMGNVTINNRRKQGVLGKILRTYSS